MSQPLFVIFGPPGSGKSLVAQFLADRLRYRHISWGSLARNADFRRQHRRAFATVDDQRVSIPRRSRVIAALIQRAVVATAAQSDQAAPLILEGFPRRMLEAKLLVRIATRSGFHIQAVIRVNPSFEAVKKRLSSRRVCQECGQYYLPFNLPSDARTCPRDGTRLARATLNIAQARREFLGYSHEIGEVFDYLASRAEVSFDVSGDDSELQIFSEILTKLRRAPKRLGGTFVRRSAATVETALGPFKLVTFQSRVDYTFHLALVKGIVRNADDVLVRVHSSCITGDIFSSSRCECGEQLKLALRRIQRAKRGVLIYLFQEGRGINIINKIDAYSLQRKGLDTVEANEALGLPAELRDYTPARDILQELGIRSVEIMTNNPDKLQKLTDLGIVISKVRPIEVKSNRHNADYMHTKKARMGHRLHGH